MRRTAGIAIGGLAYIAAFVVLHPRIGDGVVALSVLPVLAAAWAFGLAGGAIAGVVGVAINITLMQTIGHQDGFRWTQLPRIVVLIGLGTGGGWVRDLYRRQRELLEALAANRALEAQVAARAAAEANLRAMLDGSRDAIWVVRDGVIAFANPAVAALVGAADAAQLVGKDPLEALVHPDDRPMLAAWMAGVSTVPRPSELVEIHLVRADDRSHVVEVELFPIELDGKPAIMTVGRDVTARKELEARAAAADRMAVLGTLTAGIGHEINNPLSVIVGNLGFIEDQIRDADPDLVEALADSRAAAIRAGEIVRHMRVFIQAGASNAPADVARVVDSTVKMVANEVRHRASLEVDLEPTPPIALPDAQLGQILLNLLVNANQALPERRPEENKLVIRARAVAGGTRVRLEVADNGVGIPPDVRHRIFEPFFTTKPVCLGTGLGLWVCHQIVTASGGEITVDSTPGKGTTFAIEFPALAARASEPAARAAARATRRARVLVVDDDALVGRSIHRLLSDVHDLEVVQDGHVALDGIAAGQRFDVILCDLMMPEMSGMELYARLRELAPDQADRTIFMTGGAFSDEATRFVASSARMTLEKPFEHDAVRSAIAQVLDRYAS